MAVGSKRDAILSAQAELAVAVLIARRAKCAIDKLHDSELDPLTERMLIAVHSLESTGAELDRWL